jgi:predicted glutamine amidotransferase
MCRFLAIKASQITDLNRTLQHFARQCQFQLAPDGTSQEHGFGVGWFAGGKWHFHHSLARIWEADLPNIPPSSMLVVHARAATDPAQKGIIDYNQPYFRDNSAFLFNGFISQVKMPIRLEGEIGAQKIHSLLEKYTELKGNVDAALTHLDDRLRSHSKQVHGLNVAVVNGERISALCSYNVNPEYYTLHYARSYEIKLISSMPIPGFDFEPMQNRSVISF